MFNKNEFNAMVARKGITKIELAKMFKISTCALYRRLKNDLFGHFLDFVYIK